MKQIVFILMTFVYYIELASAHELGVDHGHSKAITENELLLGVVVVTVLVSFLRGIFNQRMARRSQR